jgi:hypothetical protein
VTRSSSTGRQFTTDVTDIARRELERLPLQLSTSQYQKALQTLGAELGRAARALVGSSSFALVTTPEDADFLTRGMLEELPRKRAHLVCYWTTRVGDSATVNKEFVDPSTPKNVETVVIAKSIISSGCIARTNLEEFLAARKPKQILIAAPVMVKGADEHLRASFAASVARRFKFITFAIDSQVEGGVVRPGVGGMVEERLGLTGKISPSIVKEWRKVAEDV